MKRPMHTLMTTIALALLSTAFAADTVHTTLDQQAVGMGDSVILTTRVRTGNGSSAEGHRVIPFVNGKRWGAIEKTDANGQTIHYLPLPNVGPQEVQVLVEAPLSSGPQGEWIWGNTTAEDSPQYFQQTFLVEDNTAPLRLFVAVDDEATIYLNGEEVAQVSGWRTNEPVGDLQPHLLPGENVLSVAATGGGGLAGLLVRVDGGDDSAPPLLVTDADWTYFPAAPYGWPFRAEVDGEKPQVLAAIDWSPYRKAMRDWPGLPNGKLNIAGTPKPAEGLFSEPLMVTVADRTLHRVEGNRAHRVGIQFEPWFTPHYAHWASTHAIPVTGRYWSWNPDVIRQQMIWLIESGIDFLVVDWTNHLWGKSHWHERDSNTNEVIHATTQLLEGLAVLRDEGHSVPTVVLYVGLNNGPSTTVEAVNEELQWIHSTYVRNPRFAGLFEAYLEKPLLLVHSGGGPQWKDATGASRIDESNFTVRYQSFQHEFNDHEEHGFWSWMDATLTPVPTLYDGAVEALTVSSAFFSQGGWKKEGAYGRRGGWTFLQGFRAAQQHRPRFLQLHQYQEFAGQWEGFGYGPNKDIYVDSYSIEFSDDIEPVSRTAAAYRGDGGWGFYYLNLLRGLVDLYHQETPETTVLVLAHPTDGAEVWGDTLDVSWDWLGKEPERIALRVNGHLIETDPALRHHTLDISEYPSGPMSIEVTAEGTQSRFPLHYEKAAKPAETMAPATVQAVCTVVAE